MCIFIHTVFPFISLHTQPSALSQRSTTRPYSGRLEPAVTFVSKPGLKKFPARLRLAGSRLHPTPKSQEATDSSERCELQVPLSLAQALPPLPRPQQASLYESAKTASHWSLRLVSHLGVLRGGSEMEIRIRSG